MGAGRVDETQEILHLPDDDGNGDACGESCGDGEGHEADKRAQTQQSADDEEYARDYGCRNKSVKAVGRHDARNDGGERCRGARNLHAASAQEGDKEACDHRRIDTLLRPNARGDGQGD